MSIGRVRVERWKVRAVDPGGVENRRFGFGHNALRWRHMTDGLVSNFICVGSRIAATLYKEQSGGMGIRGSIGAGM